MLPEYIQHSNLVKQQKSGDSGSLWALIKAAFEGCPAGMSFPLQLPEDKSENYLRSLVSKKAKYYGRKFVVVKHPDNWYEIARLATEEKPDPSTWKANE